MQLECRFSPEVRETLARCVCPWQSPADASTFGTFSSLIDRVQAPSAAFSLLELRNCLEKIIDSYAHESVIDTPQAVAAIGAIYGRVREALNELPEHPRILPRRVFIQTQGALKNILSALRERESNVQIQGSLAAPDLRAELEQYQDPSLAKRMSWLSYAQLDFIHTCLSESALKPTSEMNTAPSVDLLGEITERLTIKLGILHGDRLEHIPGTRLFIPRERKGISRPAIEHALLTSTDEECRETLRVGALMIALGSGMLTLPELRDFGFNGNCNTFMMSHGQQIQTGLRIVHLIAGLAGRDKRLRDVLQAYSRDALVVEGLDSRVLTACREMNKLKKPLSHEEPLSSEVITPPPEVIHQCRILLVELLSHGTHHVANDGAIVATSHGTRAES